MSLLLESIKLIDGEFRNLPYHEERMSRSLKACYGSTADVDLGALLARFSKPTPGLFKCRIVYDETTQVVEFQPYQPKVIGTLKVVYDDRIAYGFKYTDRRSIGHLYQQRNTCDDIVIVRRGLVTDSSYANLVFRRDRKWYTPGSPLLRGVMRAVLLDRGKIEEMEIGADDLKTFESFKLINAMLEFDSPESDISNIVF